MKNLLLFTLFLIGFFNCNGQQKGKVPAQKSKKTSKVIKVGGPFENSDFMYIGIPAIISSADTSAGWYLDSQKICVSGTVFQNDKTTPAPNILIYYYHTDLGGRYIHDPEVQQSMPPTPQGQTHGFLRGWVKTDIAGQYQIFTIHPKAYPNRKEPEHIHLTIKESPTLSEYYIDDILFDSDPLLTKKKRKQLGNRGGSGILQLKQKGNIFVGKRDIVLGLNIPDYPEKE